MHDLFPNTPNDWLLGLLHLHASTYLLKNHVWFDPSYLSQRQCSSVSGNYWRQLNNAYYLNDVIGPQYVHNCKTRKKLINNLQIDVNLLIIYIFIKVVDGPFIARWSDNIGIRERARADQVSICRNIDRDRAGALRRRRPMVRLVSLLIMGYVSSI